MAPGYEMGPLGVAVMKDNYSCHNRGHRSPPRPVASAQPAKPSAPARLVSPYRPGGAVNNFSTDGASLPQPPEGGGEGVVATRRGSGLRDLLGTEVDAEKERERSRLQGEALKKQVEDNKVRRVNVKRWVQFYSMALWWHRVGSFRLGGYHRLKGYFFLLLKAQRQFKIKHRREMSDLKISLQLLIKTFAGKGF